MLQLNNVSKTYGTTLALRDVTLTIAEKECVAIVGGSGSGKSTLARMMTNMEAPTSGDILWCGQNVQQMHARTLYKDVQMVFQNPLSVFSPRMKIGEFLCEPLRHFTTLNKQQRLQQAKEALHSVQLPDTLLQEYAANVSGGQLQRIVIARALLVQPKLLICDECTSALDAVVQNSILTLIRELCYGKCALLLITHDLHIAEQMTDKLYVMQQGRIIETLKPYDTPQHAYTQTLFDACHALHFA